MESNNKFVNLGISFAEILKLNKSRKSIKFSESENYTYNELNIFAEKLVIIFKTLKIKKGDIIAIASVKNLLSFSLVVACWKTGVAYSFFDSEDKSSRVKNVFKNLKPKKIFVFNKNYYFKKSYYLNYENVNNISINKDKVTFVKDKNLLAYIMYTSGSTGSPKGVLITHKNLSYFIKWTRKKFNINKNVTLTNLNPLHFDNSVFDIYASFLNGACLVPFEKNELFDARNLIKKVNRLKCDIWFSVPSLLNFLIEIFKKKIFSKLKIKKMIFGGERFPINSIRKIKNYLKNTECYNVSGPTECTCICSAHKVSIKEINKLDNIPVGNLNSYFEYKIISNGLDKNIGELCLIGPSISQGYHNKKLLTKERFFKFKNNNGYKTGDIVQKIKNNFFILGRTDNQIKFLGHRIELEEIENTLIKILNLNECLITIKKDKKFPYEKLVCYLQQKKNKKFDKIREKNVSNSLPYYMRPKEYIFIKKFKYNANGKVDRKYYSKN